MLAVYMSNGDMLIIKDNVLSWTLKLRGMDRNLPPFIDVDVYNPFTKDTIETRLNVSNVSYLQVYNDVCNGRTP